MKVLIIRFSSIGDIVLTTPVIRCVKQQVPGVEVHYLTKKVFGLILASNPYIDKLHFLDGDLDATIEGLKAERFDEVIDLHNNIRTLRVKRALKVPAHAFPKLNIRKWILTNLRWNLMPDKSVVDRYFEPVKHLGVRNDTRGMDYFLDPAKQLTNRDIPMSHWNGYVGCVIGGSFPTKQLPAEQWKKFCEQVPFPVMLLGGPEDKEMGDDIARQDKIKIYNACGKFDLNESAELVKMAGVVVSNDTGLMHIAAAFQKPIVSLWGATSPVLGVYPYYGANNMRDRIAPNSVIMEKTDLGCHPCSKMGTARCPRGHFRCMKELDMGLAVTEVQRLWKDS